MGQLHYPTFIQAILITIVWGFIMQVLGLGAVGHLLSSAVSLWFLYGWLIADPAPGFKTEAIVHPSQWSAILGLSDGPVA